MSKFIKTAQLARFWNNAKTYIDNALNGKANASHTHDYAAVSHNHAQSEVTGLADALAGKAAADHTHTGYAASGHTHTEYAASGHTHSDYALKSDIATVYKYKGSVASYDALPTGAAVGDVYNVEGDSGKNYAWDGTAWDSLGGSIQVEVATDDEIDAIFA